MTDATIPIPDAYPHALPVTADQLVPGSITIDGYGRRRTIATVRRRMGSNVLLIAATDSPTRFWRLDAQETVWTFPEPT